MKRTFLLATSLVFAGLVFLSPASLHAGSTSKKSPTPKPTPVVEKITSVSADSITVSNGKKSDTYKIHPETEVEINGTKSKASDLKTGMKVHVDSGTSADSASRITATQ